ncbi:DUF1000-domain-containing protein [Xylona heveae TC161]|uniref:DUF1000-domain-containing protein n=1 Tax=Xylona heveae (strain CBS 132557 / TC161) TaxID=1328760 RepID=A0A165IXR8_XYLHT|nr:DUF1000-domain-containing protein [Xylona heveae TC161]KZF25519.1 DUF1000-domain-containing protein [Xylona heveae TC161]
MSHHCHDEHAGHGHVHDHSDDIQPALQSLLYKQIDFGKITTLNEAAPGSGAAVVQKTWGDRFAVEPELQSDVDEQLLMFVPFTGQVRLHSILLRTSDSPSAPHTLKVFQNRDDLDFGTASEAPPTQTLQLVRSSDIQEIPVKRALFNSVQSLTLFFVDNFAQAVGAGDDVDDEDEEVTRINYIAFKGEYMHLNREPIEFLYEAAANPGDHKAIVGTKEGLGSDLHRGGM